MSTVTVSCKNPNGYLMQVGDKTIHLAGWNTANATVIYLADGSQAALTSDVPEDMWNVWREKFKAHDMFVNGLVFSSATDSRAKAETKERKGVKSGLEALDKDALDAQAK